MKCLLKKSLGFGGARILESVKSGNTFCLKCFLNDGTVYPEIVGFCFFCRVLVVYIPPTEIMGFSIPLPCSSFIFLQISFWKVKKDVS